MDSDDFDAIARRQIERNMTNHTPTLEAIDHIETLRGLAKDLGHYIVSTCPAGRERSIALTALEDCAMRAVQSIVTEGKP